MKRVVILTSALLLVAGTFHSVRAEEGSRRGGAAKSEVRIGYGMLSANSVVNSYSDMLADFLSDGSVAYANESGSGAICLSYRYRILPRVHLGATLGYERVRKDYVYTVLGAPEIVGGKNDYLTVAADLQFRYLQVPSGILSLYWGVGLGAGFHKQKLSGFAYGPDKYDETRLAYQVTPLGLTVGLKRFGAFAEVGFGYKGIFQFGAYARF